MFVGDVQARAGVAEAAGTLALNHSYNFPGDLWPESWLAGNDLLNADALADGLFTVKIFFDHGLVDDSDGGRSCGIGFRQPASLL